MKFVIPSHAEQEKIANFLSAIDQKVDLASSELEKAKQWKRGYYSKCSFNVANCTVNGVSCLHSLERQSERVT